MPGAFLCIQPQGTGGKGVPDILCWIRVALREAGLIPPPQHQCNLPNQRARVCVYTASTWQSSIHSPNPGAQHRVISKVNKVKISQSPSNKRLSSSALVIQPLEPASYSPELKRGFRKLPGQGCKCRSGRRASTPLDPGCHRSQHTHSVCTMSCPSHLSSRPSRTGSCTDPGVPGAEGRAKPTSHRAALLCK